MGARCALRQCFAPKGSDKICMMTTRLARVELLRARAGEWSHNLSCWTSDRLRDFAGCHLS